MPNRLLFALTRGDWDNPPLLGAYRDIEFMYEKTDIHSSRICSMEKMDGKKSSILLILKTLEEYSDEDHFLTQKEIIERIDADYGIELERKSVAFSLSLLQELEYDIVKGPKSGYALLSRLFDPTEVRFMTDAIFSSKAIPGKQATALSRKVQSVLSKRQRSNYSYIYKASEVNRTSSKEVFFAIDTMEEGIKRGKRISFQYRSYDERGNETLRNGGYRYIVSPYYLVNSNGFYYLLCNYREKYRPLQIFRVDLMRNLQIEDEWPIKPISSIKGLENFDISEYVNDHIYLLDGDAVSATLRIDKPYGIQYLRDWFGEMAKIYLEGNQAYAKLRCNENALFFWVLQYGDEFTLTEPEGLVKRLRAHLTNQIKKYN